MHRRSSMRIFFTAVILVGSLALLGCPKRPEVVQAPPAPAGPPVVVAPAPPPPPPPPPPRVTEVPVTPPPAPAPAPPAPPPPAPPKVQVTLKDVFFNFDKSDIGFNKAFKDDQKPAINADVAALKANPNLKITVEGHCDARGTAEYNLALGERRAKAVKDFLVGAGIAADRIAVISYGKERPFVLGNDENAWKWNRRGHFVITGQ
jgi:peptidoglycan-associated lipoprotein